MKGIRVNCKTGEIFEIEFPEITYTSVSPEESVNNYKNRLKQAKTLTEKIDILIEWLGLEVV